MTKKLLIFITIGLLIRLVVMPISFHPDIWAITFAEQLFSHGITNIYDYLHLLPDNSPVITNYGRDFFTYPPLAYFTLGIFGFLTRLVSGEFLSNLAVNLPHILTTPGLGAALFIIKLPFLLFDFGVAALLWLFFDTKKEKQAAVCFWLFNPLSIYTSFLIGQFDIIPVFFTILSLVLVKKDKTLPALLSLGIGGAYKMFPLLLIPFIAFRYGKNTFTKLLLVVVGFLPYVLSIVPFLDSSVFRQIVLFSNQSQKMLFAKIPVSGAEYLSLFVVLYLFLVFYSLGKKTSLWVWYFLVFALLFSITHFHPQWFIWISPLLVIMVVRRPSLSVVYWLSYIFWFLILLFFEPSLSISLFAPIVPTLLTAPDLSNLLSKYYDPFQLKSLFRSGLAAINIYAATIVKNE